MCPKQANTGNGISWNTIKQILKIINNKQKPMKLIYFFVSIILAIFFFRGLWRYDGPKPNNRVLGRFYYNSNVGFDEKLNAMHAFGIRRILSGSWFRVIYMFFLWLSIPVFILPLGPYSAFIPILLAMPGGFALAISVYNFRKTIRGW